jgi:peptide-methionine (S)-S-oxide reductase
MTETIVLGGGCFWCTEAVFDRVRGVVDVESGYCNGQTPHPSYEQVCTGRTGHVEVVRLVFDPEDISLREILDIFFAVHDPTPLNRQGNDVGTQYRSGIYCLNDPQMRVAEEVIRSIGGGVVTEVKPLANYSKAEDYHQDYFLNHPNEGYCAFVVRPKVGKFQNTFAKYLKR